MRNLKTTFLQEVHLPSGLPMTATAWDANDESIICAFGPTDIKPVIELKRKNTETIRGRSEHTSDFTTITSWDAPCPLPELRCDQVLLLQYFSDTSTACLILAGGDLVVVREDPAQGQEKIEIVGSVDVGIAAAAWAPDEELLAIVTRADTLILMSRDFEPVTEATMTPDDLKASNYVSVGWGKKETQFQGKRVKALRDPTMPERIDEGRLNADDDGRVCVNWRGDGAFVAVNSVVNGTRRVIRVYTREAIIDSASEPVDGLESALSWRPSGNLITGIQRLDDRIDVVFFERNGLRHGEFNLRLSKAEMGTWGCNISLSWNVDSSVLAVTFKDRVQLWTMGNYHYYLKQEVRCTEESAMKLFPSFLWHAEKPLKCALRTPTSLLDLEFSFMVCRGSTIQPHDHGIVAVTDGRTLKLTAFRHAAVPPPMAFCEVTMEETIVDCAISKTGEILALLTTTGLEIYKWNFTQTTKTKDLQTTNAQLKSTLQPSTDLSRLFVCRFDGMSLPRHHNRFTQLIIRDDAEVIFSAPGQFGRPGCLMSVEVRKSQTTDMNHETETKIAPIEADTQSAQNLLADSSQSAVWYQDTKSSWAINHESVLKEDIVPITGCPPPSALYLVPQNCKECEVLRDRVDASPSSNLCIHFNPVALTSRGDLILGSRTITHGCTSFILTDAHLIFTTSQHLLKVVHLTLPDSIEVPGDTPEVDERCRSIERGARLVTVMPSTYSVVLQMPRGNLEIIYPRVLVLAGIRQHINNEDFKSAFLSCQSHQVDMNILHDYRPDFFMDRIPLLINHIKKVSRIDEFLSKLKDEDVSQTLYKDTMKIPDTEGFRSHEDVKMKNCANPVTTSPPTNLTGKVNRICDAFLIALSSRLPSHIQNVITAHVSKRPPDFRSALTLVSTLRQSSPSKAETAISHLCFLSDATRLYDTALSLYDLELALLVAQNTQRDPREYLPFLQTLQTLPVLRRQYTIDNHLKNYSKALASLHALGAHDEVESHTVKHSLYTKALELYKFDRAHRRSVMVLYASHLSSLSQHAAAATLYESLGDYKSAYPLHALAHHWRESLTCASLIPLNPDQLSTLASSLATTCTDESRDYRSAATIHLDYLHDVPGAARLFCKGSYFADASRVLALHGLSDETNLVLDSGLYEKFGEILELLADCKTQLGAQIPRIKDLRVKKEEDPLGFYGGDPALVNGEEGVDVPDNISLAPTDASTAGGQSMFTRYGSNASKFGGTVASNVSRKTSRTKRREERKRARGKKGSVYEEEYLVASVRRLIERVNGVQDEVGRLLGGLLRRDVEGRDRAEVVDERMMEIVGLCVDAKREVWGEEERKEDTGDRPSGADGVLWDSQAEMNDLGLEKAKAPEVKVWKGPELLAL